MLKKKLKSTQLTKKYLNIQNVTMLEIFIENYAIFSFKLNLSNIYHLQVDHQPKFYSVYNLIEIETGSDFVQ